MWNLCINAKHILNVLCLNLVQLVKLALCSNVETFVLHGLKNKLL